MLFAFVVISFVLFLELRYPSCPQQIQLIFPPVHHQPIMALPHISDYEILDKLGQGSYATVYKTRYKKDRSYHAIKCVQMASLSKSSRENLVTEIRLLRKLHHKHIVTLQDFFWDDKNIYIVLEYCNMGNLSSFIRTKITLPESTCKYFLRQLASAMQYLRSNDVSHFDLKPQNLLLTRNPEIITLKVADFGFAQNLRLGETNMQVKGSPLYMAPEIVRKHKFDAKADLWSIGVILYECLFGKAPYSSKTLEELVLRLRNAEPIMIPASARISKECNDLLCSLLEHDPAKRIDFNDFFAHPFIDLQTFPSEKTFKKAIDLVTKACDCDDKNNFTEAYYLYCEALKYFVPLITEEQDAQKRTALRNRTLSYVKRAEEIKMMLTKGVVKDQAKNEVERTEQPCSSAKLNRVAEFLEPDVRFKQLFSLSNSSPALKSALEIGRKAEMYVYEHKFELALESYTSALSMLIPFTQNEPKGDRRNLLLQQIDNWMKEAESIKSILCVKQLDDEQKLSSVRSCSIQ